MTDQMAYRGSRRRVGRLFVFEGPDGVGKSTLSGAFADELRAHGVSVINVSFPGRDEGTLGALVYRLHHDPQGAGIGAVTPACLQALHVAAHLESIAGTILPALESGTSVVLDRYWWSTRVHGRVSGVEERVLTGLLDAEAAVWGSVTPAAVFLVCRDRPFRDETVSAWHALLAEYDALAALDARRCRVVRLRNDASIRVVVARAMHEVGVRRTRPSEHPPAHGPDAPSLPLSGRLGLAVRDLAPAKPSVVYDTLWRFAAERQEVFFRRIAGQDPPWTDDRILAEYRFTNAYRASDRVSQFLIRHVQYAGPQSPEEIFFRTILFKLFNKIETWKLLEAELGPVSFGAYDYCAYERVLERARHDGTKIYSAAYIMPSGRSVFGLDRKHQTHLRLLELMMRDGAPARIARARSLREVFELLRGYPTFGDFLAYQFAIDLNYSTLIDFSESDLVVPGPGARDGIEKCFRDGGGLAEHDLIRLVTERQEAEFERLGIQFRTLWGRRLQLIDCQNLFCEISKYARVAHPEVTSTSGRVRIKQRYRRQLSPVEVWYPPKWGLNERIRKEWSNVHCLGSELR